MFSHHPMLRADTSMLPTTPALYPPISPTAPFGVGLTHHAEPPAPDYQGAETFFVLSSMQDFERWKTRVERQLVVDFVKGDRHSSRSTPKAFLEHVKLVCARHSRSGRRPYVKKHPERQRKVPSRKVPDGCPATISYRTFEDKAEVHVVYNPQHAHATGPENYPFTREGRREAARSKSRSPRVPPLNDFGEDPHRAPSETPSMMPDAFTFSNPSATPLSAQSRHQPLPNGSPGFFPRADNGMISPISGTPAVSPMRPNLGLPPSPTHPFDMRIPYNGSASANVSPSRTAHSLPTPIHPPHPLPFSTPGHGNQPLPSTTPIYIPRPLPSSTPAHHPHTLPNTPGYVSHPLPVNALPGSSINSPMHASHSLPMTSPMHANPSLPSPAHASQHLPTSLHSTPLLNISTQLPPYDSSDPFSLLNDSIQHSDSSDQEYAPHSGGPVQQDGNSLAVPADPISLTITSSPSPHPTPLSVDNLYPGSLPQDTELRDYSGVMDLRAERWIRLQRLFNVVVSNSNDAQYSESSMYQLENCLKRLVAEGQGDRRATTESLGFLMGGPQ